MNYTESTRHLARNNESMIYIVIGLCISFVVFIVATAIMTVLVVRMMKKRNSDAGRVMAGGESDNVSLATNQPTLRLRDQTANVARRLQTTSGISDGPHENAGLENEDNNTNTMHNIPAAAAPATPAPRAPRSPTMVRSTNDPDHAQKLSLPPQQNSTYGHSYSCTPSPEPPSLSDHSGHQFIYDSPHNTAPVYFNTQGEPIYQRPRNTPVYVTDNTLDNSGVYNHPPSNPVPVHWDVPEDAVYQRPRNTFKHVTDDSVYNRLPPNSASVHSHEQGDSVYQTPSNTPMHMTDTTTDDSVYSRPSHYPVPVYCDTHGESTCESVSECLSNANSGTSGSPVYDQPPRQPVPVNNGANEESVYERLSVILDYAGNITNDRSTYDRPRKTPVPVSNNTHNTIQEEPLSSRVHLNPEHNSGTHGSLIYDRFFPTVEHGSSDTDGSLLYARPPPISVAADSAKSSQAPPSLPQRALRSPLPAPRPSKSAAVRKVQDSLL